MTNQKNNFSFENGMAILRQIIGTLENGNISLNKSVEEYQAATKIGAILTKQLDDANNQVSRNNPFTDDQGTDGNQNNDQNNSQSNHPNDLPF